jgi:hypothetical protein
MAPTSDKAVASADFLVANATKMVAVALRRALHNNNFVAEEKGSEFGYIKNDILHGHESFQTIV